ncbi:MAG: hypothetical protein RR244_03005, partial [Oscillospiraceae bacterium]
HVIGNDEVGSSNLLNSSKTSWQISAMKFVNFLCYNKDNKISSCVQPSALFLVYIGEDGKEA